jgi:hypothetical protein
MGKPVICAVIGVGVAGRLYGLRHQPDDVGHLLPGCQGDFHGTGESTKTLDPADKICD